MSSLRERMRRRFEGADRLGLVVLSGLVALAGMVGVLHVRDFPQLSPVDELQHIDYLYKASRGDVVRLGDRVEQSAMREQACRGHDSPIAIPPCDAPDLDPKDFQDEGFNSAFIHPPLYYVTTGVPARALRWTVGLESLVTAGRLLGAVWLAAGVILLWLLMAEFDIPIAARAVLVTVVVTAPPVVLSAATINPDATALAAGAAVLLATLLAERGRLHWVVPGVLAAVAIGFKSTNIAGVGVCVLYLLVRFIQARGTVRRPALLLGVIVAGMAVATVIWLGVQGAIAHGDRDDNPQIQPHKVDSFPSDGFRQEWQAAVTPFRRAGYVSSSLDTPRLDDLAQLVDAAFLAGCIVAVGYSKARSRQRALGLAALGAMALVGPGFVIVNYVVSGTFVLIPARYGISILPALAVVCAVPLRQRVLLGAGAALAGWITVLTVFELATR